MIRAVAVFCALASVILFPWPYAAAVAIAAGLFEPLTPLALGFLADVLYYIPATGMLPRFTIAGLVATVALFFVQRWLRASIIVA